MDSAEMKIKQAATELKDHKMFARITAIDLKSKEVQYHHSCRRDYLNKAKAVKCNGKEHDCSSKIRYHKEALATLKEYLDSTLVHNEGSELLTSLHRKYMESIDDTESIYPASRLCGKIIKEYPN